MIDEDEGARRQRDRPPRALARRAPMITLHLEQSCRMQSRSDS
jgi:hypothetical protein